MKRCHTGRKRLMEMGSRDEIIKKAEWSSCILYVMSPKLRWMKMQKLLVKACAGARQSALVQGW